MQGAGDVIFGHSIAGSEVPRHEICPLTFSCDCRGKRMKVSSRRKFGSALATKSSLSKTAMYVSFTSKSSTGSALSPSD